MSQIENKIKNLNIKLPEPKAPVGAYVATRIVGKLLYISGQVSIDENAKLITGKICLLYTSPSPRDPKTSRMPSSA